MFLPDQKGAGHNKGFPDLVRPSVCPYVRLRVSINFILYGQFALDPQYFYRFLSRRWLVAD